MENGENNEIEQEIGTVGVVVTEKLGQLDLGSEPGSEEKGQEDKEKSQAGVEGSLVLSSDVGKSESEISSEKEPEVVVEVADELRNEGSSRDPVQDVQAVQETVQDVQATVEVDVQDVQEMAEEDVRETAEEDVQETVEEDVRETAEEDVQDAVKLEKPEETTSLDADRENGEKNLKAVEEPTANDSDENDDDFGDFSDASFDDFETVEQPVNFDSTAGLPSEIFKHPKQLESQLNVLMNSIYKDRGELTEFKANENHTILSARSEAIWNELITLPKLLPPDWKRSNIRRHLLISIGAPVDLDEVMPTESSASVKTPGIVFENRGETALKDQPTVEKSKDDAPDDALVQKKSEAKQPEDPLMIVIKSVDNLNINESEFQAIKDSTAESLTKIEDSLQSVTYYETLLQDEKNEELAEVLNQLKAHELELSKILSVWHDELTSLTKDHETFEAVVQNVVGYTQKVQRQESFKNEKDMQKKLKKQASQKKTGFFWNN